MNYILITGAKGFIGRHLAKKLANSGIFVAGLGHGNWSEADRSSWGVAYWHSADVNKVSLASIYSELGKPEGIYHFAGGSSVGIAWADPYLDFNRTVSTTVELLEWVRSQSPSTPLVVASSAAVYGACHFSPINENSQINPFSQYGIHKLMMENLCRSYASRFNLLITIPRLFSVYGPFLRKQLMWDICNQMLSTEDVILGGSGSEIRDWTHVRDITLVLEQQIKYADVSVPVFNVASGRPVTVRKLAEMLASAWSTNSPPTIRFNGCIRPGDPSYLCADVSKLSRYSLECDTLVNEGIVDYVNWFRFMKDKI
jgi:UDP-glucose 4-epimerase